MKTILIKGAFLTPVQIELIPFKGKNSKEWLECHSFYFSADGTQLSTNLNEYYPVCTSLDFLPY